MNREPSVTFAVVSLAIVSIAAVIAGSLIGAGVALRGGYGLASTAVTELPETTIQFTPTDGGGCTPSYPKPLRRYNGKKVTWHVYNACASPMYIRFDSFQQKRDDGSLGGPEEILKPPKPADSVPARQNNQDGSKDIDATVSKDFRGEPELFFKYAIYAGRDANTATLIVDPDIDIWP